jgi:hypothetical protein
MISDCPNMGAGPHRGPGHTNRWDISPFRGAGKLSLIRGPRKHGNDKIFYSKTGGCHAATAAATSGLRLLQILRPLQMRFVQCSHKFRSFRRNVCKCLGPSRSSGRMQTKRWKVSNKQVGIWKRLETLEYVTMLHIRQVFQTTDLVGGKPPSLDRQSYERVADLAGCGAPCKTQHLLLVSKFQLLESQPKPPILQGGAPFA